ncbi:glycosyltransferase [Leucobacter sp. HY1908]
MFVSWTRSNGRTEDLAGALELSTEFLFRRSRFGLLGRYVHQARATRQAIRRAAPSSVMLMLPPAPALWALRGVLARDTPLVADLHTGFFLDPKWTWATRPSLSSLRRHGDIAIVTNNHLAQVCRRQGVEAVVLHDLIVERAPQSAQHYLLCPVSYANDEPISEILKAARLTPDVEWRLTGSAPAAVRSAAPSNVSFTGFLDADEFDRSLAESAGVVALTTRPHTMQRAGYEAFNTAVPQITSDFPELRDFYRDSAVYATADAQSIAAAARELLNRRASLVERILALRPQRVAEQQAALATVHQFLNTGAPLRATSHQSERRPAR